MFSLIHFFNLFGSLFFIFFYVFAKRMFKMSTKNQVSTISGMKWPELDKNGQELVKIGLTDRTDLTSLI